MQLKTIFLKLLDVFLFSNHWFVYFFLENPFMCRVFLRKYLRNRPDHFFAYYRWKPASRNSQYILILKTDAIGDYLLFRNFLAEIAAEFRPKGFKMVLAGNSAWKDLALELDSTFVDEFIWLDRGGMNRKPSMERQLDFLSGINRYSYRKLLYPNYSREWEAGDWLVKHIPAFEKYAFNGNAVNETLWQHEEGNTFYSHLLTPEAGGKFDFFRNREIVSAFSGRDSLLEAPEIQHSTSHSQNGRYAVFFPGASLESRRWPEYRFSELGKMVNEKFGLDIRLAGGPSEKDLCDRIIGNDSLIFENLAGKTSLPELLKIIAGSYLLVSNDTSAIHLGAQSGIPSICIFKGNNFGRCMPYPEGLLQNFRVCMPQKLREMTHADCVAQFSENDGLEISDISVEDVWNAVLELLPEHS